MAVQGLSESEMRALRVLLSDDGGGGGPASSDHRPGSSGLDSIGLSDDQKNMLIALIRENGDAGHGQHGRKDTADKDPNPGHGGTGTGDAAAGHASDWKSTLVDQRPGLWSSKQESTTAEEPPSDALSGPLITLIMHCSKCNREWQASTKSERYCLCQCLGLVGPLDTEEMRQMAAVPPPRKTHTPHATGATAYRAWPKYDSVCDSAPSKNDASGDGDQQDGASWWDGHAGHEWQDEAWAAGYWRQTSKHQAWPSERWCEASGSGDAWSWGHGDKATTTSSEIWAAQRSGTSEETLHHAARKADEAPPNAEAGEQNGAELAAANIDGWKSNAVWAAAPPHSPTVHVAASPDYAGPSMPAAAADPWAGPAADPWAGPARPTAPVPASPAPPPATMGPPTASWAAPSAPPTSFGWAPAQPVNSAGSIEESKMEKLLMLCQECQGAKRHVASGFDFFPHMLANPSEQLDKWQQSAYDKNVVAAYNAMKHMEHFGPKSWHVSSIKTSANRTYAVTCKVCAYGFAVHIGDDTTATLDHASKTMETFFMMPPELTHAQRIDRSPANLQAVADRVGLMEMPPAPVGAPAYVVGNP